MKNHKKKKDKLMTATNTNNKVLRKLKKHHGRSMDKLRELSSRFQHVKETQFPTDVQQPLEHDEYILYFIRHGEALHNVLEKAAKKQVLQTCLQEGLTAHDEETLRRMEEARQGILNNDELQDCPLTSMGKKEALQAKDVMVHLASHTCLPSPQEVLVSPLRRALQTADLIFPNSCNIHVREELQERQTLKACDTRLPSRVLSETAEFSRFSMKRLRLASLQREELSNFPLQELVEIDETIEEEEESSSSNSNSSSSTNDSQEEESNQEAREEAKRRKASWNRTHEQLFNHSGTLHYDTKQQVEEKHMLRERTKLLFGLVQESQQHHCLAIVAHKGYLRELERGPLGQEDATEFKNCEVRVYKIKLSHQQEQEEQQQQQQHVLPSKVERLV